MKYLLVCFACVLATAVASPVYGSGYGAAPIRVGPARPAGLYRVDRLVPAAPALSYAAPLAAPLALSAPLVARGGYGGKSAGSAIDGEVLSLARLALSLPTPPADLSLIGGHGAGYGRAVSAY